MKEGWLLKSRLIYGLPYTRNYFALTERSLNFYSTHCEGMNDKTEENLRGEILLIEIEEISQEGLTLTLRTWYRTFTLEAADLEEAKSWMSAISTSMASCTDNPNSPNDICSTWAVDAVKVGGKEAQIKLVVPLDTVPCTARVALTDNTVIDVTDLKPGEKRTLLEASEETLVAEVREEMCVQQPYDSARLKKIENIALIIAMLSTPLSPSFATAILALILANRFVPQSPLKPLPPTQKLSLVLHSSPTTHHSEETHHRSSFQERQRNNAKARRKSALDFELTSQSRVRGMTFADAQALSSITEEDHEASSASITVVNFSGEYVLDLSASDDPTEMLTEMGVPWIARKAIRSTSRTLLIEHAGIEWTETIQAPMITKTIKFRLDETPSSEISPVDKSSVTSVTKVEGDKVVSRNTFSNDPGRSQHIERSLVDGGKMYVVDNTLTVREGKVIKTRSYFVRKELE